MAWFYYFLFRTHEFGDIGGWGFLHFNPTAPPSFEEYQRHVNPIPRREDFPSKGFSRFLSCRGYVLPTNWDHLLPESNDAREMYNLGAMQMCARRLCPDALSDPRDEPIYTPEMGINDAYYSFLASTQQQRRPTMEQPLLAIENKHPTRDESLDFGLRHITGRSRNKAMYVYDYATCIIRKRWPLVFLSQSSWLSTVKRPILVIGQWLSLLSPRLPPSTDGEQSFYNGKK